MDAAETVAVTNPLTGETAVVTAKAYASIYRGYGFIAEGEEPEAEILPARSQAAIEGVNAPNDAPYTGNPNNPVALPAPGSPAPASLPPQPNPNVPHGGPVTVAEGEAAPKAERERESTGHPADPQEQKRQAKGAKRERGDGAGQD